MSDPNCCFTLRIRLYNNDKRIIVIRAFDDLIPQWDEAGRIRLTCEVTHGGKVIFPRGQLTCALHGCSDGIKAKELVMSLVAMAPSAGSGVDEEYWDGYTQEQIDWANEHWEALDIERETRYCDETGSAKSERS